MPKRKYLESFTDVDVLSDTPVQEGAAVAEKAPPPGTRKKNGVMPSEPGVTLLRVPEYNRNAYLLARRAYTYAEIVQIDDDGIARCRTLPAVQALLIRGFTRIPVTEDV